MKHPIVQYWLDSKSIIQKVGEDWDEFAETNQATEIAGEAVIGRPLYSFIAGDTTRLFVEAMLQAVRVRQEPIRQPYRCDSPNLRREMEMLLLPEPDGHVRLIHRTLNIEPFPRPYLFNTVIAETTQKHMIRCSMCNRILQFGVWRDIHEVDELTDRSGVIPVVYRVCTDCRTQVNKKLPPDLREL